MQNLAGTDPLVAAAISNSPLIAADLRSPIAKIEVSIRLIEAAVTLADARDRPGSTGVFVLNDPALRHGERGAWRLQTGLDHAPESLSDPVKSAEIGSAALRRPRLIG